MKKEKILPKKESVLVFLAAENFSESEFVALKNAIERSGLKMFIASDAHSLCTGDKGLKVRPDVSTFNMKAVNFGALAIVGGEGIRKYWANPTLQKLISDFHNQKKPIGALCLAPVLLARAGVLNGKKAVCFPDARIELEKEGVEFVDDPVVIDESIVTARDPLSAEEFAESFVYLVTK